jgi:protein-S-isoprenylcysteine O-methyltransferase Ste14
MTENSIYSYLIIASFALAGLVFVILFFISAPYGRHIRRGWGATIPGRLGWLAMETPAAVLFVVYFLLGSAPKNLAAYAFLVIWEAHYIHRALIYPFSLSDGRKRMPLLVTVMAVFFNVGNTYINGRYIFTLSGGYANSWLRDPRFIFGLMIFIAGFIINRWADRTLRKLRLPGETGYSIPQGGLYRWISCPNYLGEIIEWTGWAIATWSLPGLAFAAWTFANLAPRASTHQAWYHQHFSNYPRERKALIPGIW